MARKPIGAPLHVLLQKIANGNLLLPRCPCRQRNPHSTVHLPKKSENVEKLSTESSSLEDGAQLGMGTEMRSEGGLWLIDANGVEVWLGQKEASQPSKSCMPVYDAESPHQRARCPAVVKVPESKQLVQEK